jgi:hypothetical protein
MKKTLTLAFTWVMINANAQYFEHVYGSTSYEEIFSGMNTNLVGPGFMLSGVRTATNGLSNALSLTRTDINGNITGSQYFKKNYSIYFNSSLTPIMRVREAFSVELSSTRFALAGVCYKDQTLQKYCVYYAQVDQNGFPVPDMTSTTGYNMKYYDIGTDSYYQVRNIRLSPSNDKLYVVGLSVNQTSGKYYSMILKIDVATGVLDWSWIYNITGNSESAYDAVEDPNTGELVVVGYYQRSLFDTEAYILRLDPSNGNVITSSMLFTSNIGNTNEMFKCITIADNGDYIISGQTTMLGNVDSWTLRIDNAFTTIGWNVCNDYYGSGNDNYAIDVMERMNTNGQSEVYVAGQVIGGVFGNADIEVYKLDGSSGSCQNQFTYGTGQYQYVTSIDQNNTGTADGLSLFGLTEVTTSQLANKDFVIYKAYYNGITSCDYDVNTTESQNGPNVIYSETHVQGDRFNTSEAWLKTIANFNDLTICYSATVTGGDNARPAQATGISENRDLSGLDVLVDQGNDVLTVLSDNQTPRLIKVTDITGKQVLNNFSENQNKLDISNLETGIYILSMQTQNGDLINRKFVKE